jgi:hypothetical protein
LRILLWIVWSLGGRVSGRTGLREVAMAVMGRSRVVRAVLVWVSIATIIVVVVALVLLGQIEVLRTVR